MSEHQKIQRYIIKSTPFGQLSDVLKDLDKVSPIDLSSSSLNTAIQQYNEQHLAIATSNQGQILLMANNKIGQNQYIDQNNQKIYTVDHIKLQVLNVGHTNIQLVPQVKQLVKFLSAQVQAYVDNYYKTPNASQVFADISQEGLSVFIGLTSKNVSIGKFYTGQWFSKWKVNKDQIVGEVNIKAHFFEGGNVQFNQKRQTKQKYQFSADMHQSSKAITKVIEKFEAEVQEDLNVLYDEMPNKFFKKLRKLAPYTKTKMSWNINSIKMNQNLLGSSKQ